MLLPTQVTGGTTVMTRMPVAKHIVQTMSREKLANFEMPGKVLFMAQLPISVGTKIQKYKQREQYQDLFEE